MEQLLIHGGKKLHGTVHISGAKNAVLPLMAATLLAPGKHTLGNIPHLRDIATMEYLLIHMGAYIDATYHVRAIDTSALKYFEAPYERVKTMRASSLVLGPLLARWGRAKVSLPGGCAIGARPINLHLQALEKMGADIRQEQGYVVAEAKKLFGATIVFDTITVTGTENIMMAATLAEGTTVLKNAAKEPEVLDLADCLNKMGAKITGAGTNEITIEGVTELQPTHHEVIPDRIEAGTYLMAGAITGGEIKTTGCPAQYLEALLEKLRASGCEIMVQGTEIVLKGPKRPTAVNVTTSPFPGFATDLQAQFMSLMTVAEGTSVITETIFENRFQHALELARLGAQIKLEGHTAIITGIPKLSRAPMMATDLRASASLVLAALVADGTSTIDRIYHIDRGYEDIAGKLRSLGAEIQRRKA